MLDRKELIDLIEELKKFSRTEREEEKLLEKLESLVLDPEISDYIYWTDMSSEEIADKVLNYNQLYWEINKNLFNKVVETRRKYEKIFYTWNRRRKHNIN